jgi:hypothetical protein
MASLSWRLSVRSASLRSCLGDLLLEVGAAIVVFVPNLGDRGHMDGVVGAPVAAQ